MGRNGGESGKNQVKWKNWEEIRKKLGGNWGKKGKIGKIRGKQKNQREMGKSGGSWGETGKNQGKWENRGEVGKLRGSGKIREKLGANREKSGGKNTEKNKGKTQERKTWNSLLVFFPGPNKRLQKLGNAGRGMAGAGIWGKSGEFWEYPDPRRRV